MPAFHARYAAVPMKLPSYPDLRLVYVNRDSAKVGVTVSGSTLTVPGYLFTGSAVHAELVDKIDKLAAILPPGAVASAAIAAPPGAAWACDHARAAGAPNDHGDHVECAATRDGPAMTVTITNASSSVARVEEVVLKRAP
jgi:hypothetical protein